jgi:hypothetical protein
MLRKLCMAVATVALLTAPIEAVANPHGGHGGGGHGGGGFHGGGGGGFHGGGGGFHGGGHGGGGFYGGGHHGGGGYYGGGGRGRYWGGRWYGYGIGPCWRWNPFFGRWIWVCG